MPIPFNPVSIVMPAFNAARHLAESIESVLEQSMENWEMVVVDDCSTDDTGMIARKYASSDSRIHVIHHKINRGVAHARNSGLDAASHPCVAFLDSDDVWIRTKLQVQLEHMRAHGYGFTYTAFRRMNETGEKVGTYRPVPPFLKYRDLLRNTAIVTSTTLIDRRITGDFRVVPMRHEDLATWLAILRRGITAHGLADDLVRYRVGSNSVSGNKFRSASWVWKVYREAENLPIPYASWCFVNYLARAIVKRGIFGRLLC